MTAAQHVVAVLIEEGYHVHPDPDDSGVLRVRTEEADGKLVGLLVIRSNRITYAEHLGTVYPFWSNESYHEQIRSLIDDMRKRRP